MEISENYEIMYSMNSQIKFNNHPKIQTKLLNIGTLQVIIVTKLMTFDHLVSNRSFLVY